MTSSLSCDDGADDKMMMIIILSDSLTPSASCLLGNITSQSDVSQPIVVASNFGSDPVVRPWARLEVFN